MRTPPITHRIPDSPAYRSCTRCSRLYPSGPACDAFFVRIDPRTTTEICLHCYRDRSARHTLELARRLGSKTRRLLTARAYLIDEPDIID